MTTPRWSAIGAIATTFALLSGCTHAAPPEHGGAATGADARFEALSARFLQDYLALEPVAATHAGEHRYDDRWPEPWPAGERAERDVIARTREALDRIDVDALAPSNRVDARILANQLAAWTFDLDELRRPERDPLYYTTLVGDGLDPLLTRSFAPVEARFASLSGRLAGIPAVLAAARRNLAHPPRVHTETAVQQARGLVDLLERDLPRQAVVVPALSAELNGRAAAAARAMRAFVAFLEQDLLPRSDGDFRLGRARFERKFRLHLDTETTPDELVAKARTLLAATKEDMARTAIALWPELFGGAAAPDARTDADRMGLVRKALDALARDHPTNATIVDDARRIGEAATAFVRQRELVTVPPEPMRVVEVPEYRRGVAVAYCDSSGALERRPETFVAISPTPADWPAGRVESFYREYNRSMLAELMIHEAMPGHFVQIADGRAGATPVRAVFRSGPFVEGWATYAEWLMARNGFGGLRVRLQHDKMMLRAAANVLLDHGVHAGTMDEREALRLMMEDALQEEGEAVGKWRRAQLTSTQLSSYLLGYLEVMALRERAERAPGFTERAYHDRLLSHGAPPPRDLALLLFGDRAQR